MVSVRTGLRTPTNPDAKVDQTAATDETAAADENAPIDGDADDQESTRPDLKRRPSQQQPSQESKVQGRQRARTGDQTRRAQLDTKVPPKPERRTRPRPTEDDVVRVDTAVYSKASTVGDLYQSTMDALTLDDVNKVARTLAKGTIPPAFTGNMKGAYEAFLAKKGWPDGEGARVAFAQLAYARVGYTSSTVIGGEGGERRFAVETLMKVAPTDGKTLGPQWRAFVDAAIDPRTPLTDAEKDKLQQIYVDNGDGTKTSLHALRNRNTWDLGASKALKAGMPGVGYRTTIDAGFAWQQADPARYAFTSAASQVGYSGAEIELAAREAQRRGAPLWGTGAGFNSAFTSKEDYEQRGKFQMVAGRMMGEYSLPDYAVRDLQDARRALRTGYASVDEYRQNLGKSAPGTWLTEQLTAANTAVGGFLEKNGLDNPVFRGAREAVNEYAQVGGNLLNMGAMLAYKPYAGIVKGDFRLQSEDEDLYWNAAPRRLENAVDAANQKIPGEDGTVASVFRGLTNGVAKMPVYAASTVAPPLLIFWNAGKYANKPIDKLAAGLTTDALAIMTGGIGQGPLAASLTKKLEQAGLNEARALLATKTGAAVVSATTNTALPAGEAAFKLYGPGSEKLTPEERAALEKQLSVQALSANAAIGFTTAMLSPSHKDVDVQLQKNGTVLGDLFTAQRPDGRVYAGTVKTKQGTVEFLELDPKDPRIQAKLKTAKEVTSGQVDVALVASRVQNRVKPGDVEALTAATTKYATTKLKSDLEVAQAATKSADFTPTIPVGTQAARMNGLTRAVPGATKEIQALGLQDVERVFGPGPHSAQLARMAEHPGFAAYARANPADAKYLYEMNQAVDVSNMIANAAKSVGEGPQAFAAVAKHLKENGPTVQRQGAFVVVERKPGQTNGEPALEMTLAPDKDHNGAFAYSSVVDDGTVKTVKSDLVQPMRVSLDRIKTPDGKPITYDQVAIFGSHGGPRGFDGGSNREIAKMMAERLKDRPDVKAILVVACSQGERRFLSNKTNAVEFQQMVNEELQKLRGGRTLTVFANEEIGSTATKSKPLWGPTGDEQYVRNRYVFFGERRGGDVDFVPAGQHKFAVSTLEKVGIVGVTTLGAEAAAGAGVYYAFLQDDPPKTEKKEDPR